MFMAWALQPRRRHAPAGGTQQTPQAGTQQTPQAGTLHAPQGGAQARKHEPAGATSMQTEKSGRGEGGEGASGTQGPTGREARGKLSIPASARIKERLSNAKVRTLQSAGGPRHGEPQGQAQARKRQAQGPARLEHPLTSD